MRYYLGIDGGGTKTTAVICDEQKNICFTSRGDGINHNVIGMEAARAHLQETLRDITYPLTAAFIGSAALSGPAAPALIRQLCDGIVPCALIGMDSDVAIALETMEQPGPAAIVIAGTGSMCAGRLTDGRVIHTGGWGPVLGDEGSGYRIALRGMQAALRATEGSAEKTVLKDALFSYFDIRRTDDLIETVYGKPLSPREIAAFAPEVFRCADVGDPVARDVILSEAKALSATISALLRQLPAGAPLGLWGGMFQHYKEYCGIFGNLLRGPFPETQVALLPHPPEYGAILAAMRLEQEATQ